MVAAPLRSVQHAQGDGPAEPHTDVDNCVDERALTYGSAFSRQAAGVSVSDDLAQIWGHVVSELGTSPDITPRQLAFVRLARPLGLFDGTLLLAVGNDFTKDYLESRVRTEVTHALSEAIGREARFAVSVDPDLDDQAPPMPPAPVPTPAVEAAP